VYEGDDRLSGRDDDNHGTVFLCAHDVPICLSVRGQARRESTYFIFRCARSSELRGKQFGIEWVAQHVLCTALDMYERERRPLPVPSNPAKGQHSIDLGPRVAIKFACISGWWRRASSRPN
jgi:hypothetical protein